MVASILVKRLFILILTEDDGAAQPLTLRLRAHGHEVFIARSEDQAVRTLLVHASDVILIDTWLDGEDGYEIADRLCVPMRRRPVLVGITGHDPDADRLRTHRFDHHVPKPVDATALAEYLSAHSDRRANGTRA
jgi:DNA-binding response OmpR family regulator